MYMLSFFSFISEKKNIKSYFIDRHGFVVPSKPITIKLEGSKAAIKEENNSVEKTHLHTLPGQKVEGDRKAHFSKKSDEIHSIQGAPEKKHLDALDKYTTYNRRTGFNASKRINEKLIDNHKAGQSPTEGLSKADISTHKRISEYANRPMGKASDVYSGTHIDGEKAAKESKIFYSPAHISASHDVDVARNFAMRKGIPSRGFNIMHISLKPTDKAVHVGNHSVYSGEHETIIPAGTRLIYSHTTHHHDDDGYHYRVHHYTVDS